MWVVLVGQAGARLPVPRRFCVLLPQSDVHFAPYIRFLPSGIKRHPFSGRVLGEGFEGKGRAAADFCRAFAPDFIVDLSPEIAAWPSLHSSKLFESETRFLQHFLTRAVELGTSCERFLHPSLSFRLMLR